MSYTCLLAVSVALAVPYAWGLAVLARAADPRPAPRDARRAGQDHGAADAAAHTYDTTRLAAARAAIRVTD